MQPSLVAIVIVGNANGRLDAGSGSLSFADVLTTASGDVVLCTSTLLYGMRPKSSGNDSVPQRIASCEWVPGANKHRTLLDVQTTLVAPSNETSPFSPSGSTFGHGMMWKPSATRLEELREIKEKEDETIRQKAWVCVAISLLMALCVAWLLTSPPEAP
eukprot:COSAG02_NODE_9_length_59728_cov_36.104714_59_plen_159_part_00